MKTFMRVIAVLAAMFCIENAAQAQEKPGCVPAPPILQLIQMLGNFSGQCKQAVYLGDDRTSSCANSANMITYSNGRAGFSFRLNPNLDIVLTGGKDSQPATKTLYQLEIDKFSEGRSGQTEKSEASGTCSLNTENKDAAVITCSVKAKGKESRFEFVANGAPAITKFCPPD